MTTERFEPVNIVLKRVVLGFGDISKPGVPKGYESSEPKYQADFILDPNNPEHDEALKSLNADYKRIRKYIAKVHGAAVAKKIPESPTGMDKPFMGEGNEDRLNKKGDEAYKGYADNWYINAKNKFQPDCRLRDKSVMTEEEMEKKLYWGAVVNGSVNLYPQNDGKAIRCSLRWIQFVEDGEAFGGGNQVDDSEFEDLSDGGIDLDFDEDDDF